MQKGQGLLQQQQQQQGAKAGDGSAGATIRSSPSLSVNNPSSLSHAPASSSPHTSSSSPSPSPRNPHPNPNPTAFPSPGFKSYPNQTSTPAPSTASPSPDFNPFHPNPHHQKPPHPSHFAQSQAQAQHQQWQQQLQLMQQVQQQQQQQVQHHLHQQGQGQQLQQQQQQLPHHVQNTLDRYHTLQQQRKGVPSDQFPAFQGLVPGNANVSGPQLFLPPRGFGDASQHQQQQVHSLIAPDTAQLQAQGAQIYAHHQQALFVAQKKAQENTHAGATGQEGSQSSQDAKRQQLQAQQGHQHAAATAKASGQFLLADQQTDQQRMNQVHDLKTDARMQPGLGSPSMSSGITRPSLAGGANQVNGLPHAGMPLMQPLQLHHLDLSSSRPLLPPSQYMHPQLRAQLAAMQKAATDTGQLAHNSTSKSQDVVLRNFGSPTNAQQHGGMVTESTGMVLGKGHQSMQGGAIVPNANIRQQSQPQLSDYSMERGVLSLNRPSGNVSKSSVGGLLPSMPEKGPVGAATGPSTQDTELQHVRQQQLQDSMGSSQVTNSLIQQAKFHPQKPDGENLQQGGIQHPFFQQQGGIQHFQQQQQLKQVQAMSQPQQQPQQHSQPNACFTRQQLMILKSQILAFRRLKRGERISPEILVSIGIPAEVLRSMAPSFISSQQSHPGTNIPERPFPPAVEMALATTGKEDIGMPTVGIISGNATSKLDDKAQRSAVSGERAETLTTPPQSQANNAVETSTPAAKPIEALMAGRESTLGVRQSSHDQVTMEDSGLASTSNMPTLPCSPNSVPSATISKKPIGPATSNQQKPLQLLRRYRGPLFDFPPMGRKIEGPFQANNPWGSPIALEYDVKQLLTKEATRVIDRKRVEKLTLIDALLTSGVEKKCIPTELVMKLRIEQKKLRLMALQVRVREEVEEHQQDIMALSERGYRKFVRSCERQRVDLARQLIQLQKSTREKQLKSLFSWRKRLLEAHWAVRDARTTRNRGVAKYHERMLREFSKRRDEDRNKRMEALKNNDVDTYREMLKQQQTKLPGDAGERFQVLSSFLSQTEDYLHKLGGKISAVKYQQERDEAAVAAMLAAKAQGLSEEEVNAAAIRAREEVDEHLHSPDRASDSVSKYYRLAHAVNERIARQPSMLRAGILRDYQLVGLQWMLSLYNNRLNGILADEMGLGKTVQVMALIAYLMEFKGNYGPHLIIVPNAVIVNWKSELLRWLPSVSCIFYVGGKEQRSKLYSQEVCAMKFNVLVTTYEFIMRDRSKLSKVDWKYLIIDEAQRMKDRESRLSRDLDRFRCQRRLLLTGTPLQNDLRELWSLLNLLLPEVFDNSKSFQDWFSMPFQKDSTSLSLEDDWLETEKKVIVIHRLHQILEPFMLRRRVEDVEGSLPQKVSIILRCKMSALQAAIYDWIKATGTIRLNPQDEELRVAAKKNKRQKRAYAPLQNKCMELRKVCNHPLLNYPFYGERMNEFSIRSCGKLWVLDRILIKLQNTGHRVLLFSTMTKLLDILEEYLQWRGLIYRRIDGTTTLESREAAIVEFNRPGSDCFIFLLSIRAAGRGLNLQTADTVIIYDPDPNPKNEEQAVARAHRIGQRREVRVLYMEAVVETILSFEKEDEIRSGGSIDMDDDDMAGKDRYVGSVESLVRNTIQQHKIEMADEVINAGRFDQRTTHEERRMTLEALLHDEERYQERVHDVPSMQEVNRMIARSNEEVELFDQMDEELDWPGEMIQHEQVPKWLCVGSREVNAAVKAMSKQALKKGTVEGLGTAEAEEKLLSEPFDKVSRKRQETSPEKNIGDVKKRRKTSESGRYETATEVLAERGQRSDYDDEEEGEIRKDLYGDDADVAMGAVEPEEGEVSEEEEVEGEGQAKTEFLDLNCVGEAAAADTVGGALESSQDEEAEEAEAEEEEEEEEDTVRNEEGLGLTLLLAQQKFGSLAALESRPTTQVMVEELEEGEIAASGDSHFEAQASDGSGAQEPQDGGAEEEQAVQPMIKGKRSVRQPRRRLLEMIDRSSGGGVKFPAASDPPLLALPSDRPLHELDRQTYMASERKIYPPFRKSHGAVAMETMLRRPNQPLPPAKRRQQMEPVPTKQPPESFALQLPCMASKHGRAHSHGAQLNSIAAVEPQKESVKLISGLKTLPSSSVAAARMPEITQKKCKASLLKLKGAVEKDGPQASVIFEIPKRTKNPGYYKLIASPLDAQTIEQRLDRLEYGSVLDFAADVLLMLDNAARFYKSPEVKAYIRRLQALYLQRMHHSFHDIDFNSLKTRPLATMSQQPAASSAPHPQQQQQKASNKAGVLRSQVAEPSVTPPGAYTAAAKTSEPPKEEKSSNTKSVQGENKRPQKKVAAKVQKASERLKMRHDHRKGGAGELDEPRHPLDLVIRRKRRRARGGRPSGKTRAISMVAPDTNCTAKSVVGTSSRIASASANNRLGIKMATKKARTVSINNGSGDGSSRHSGLLRAFASSAGLLPIPVSTPRPPPEGFEVPRLNKGPGGMPGLTFGHWVKKTRTDATSKRRPSHL